MSGGAREICWNRSWKRPPSKGMWESSCSGRRSDLFKSSKWSNSSGLVYLIIILFNFLSRLVCQLLPRLRSWDKKEEKPCQLHYAGNRWGLQHQSCFVSINCEVLHFWHVLSNSIIMTWHRPRKWLIPIYPQIFNNDTHMCRFKWKKREQPVCANPNDHWVQKEMRRLDLMRKKLHNMLLKWHTLSQVMHMTHHNSCLFTDG